MNYDGIVIGAGIAGAVAARELAEKGNRRITTQSPPFCHLCRKGAICVSCGRFAFNVGDCLLIAYFCASRGFLNINSH